MLASARNTTTEEANSLKGPDRVIGPAVYRLQSIVRVGLSTTGPGVRRCARRRARRPAVR